MIHLKRLLFGLALASFIGGISAGVVFGCIYLPKVTIGILLIAISYVGGVAWLEEKDK
jgi:hypothetical protein